MDSYIASQAQATYSLPIVLDNSVSAVPAPQATCDVTPLHATAETHVISILQLRVSYQKRRTSHQPLVSLTIIGCLFTTAHNIIKHIIKQHLEQIHLNCLNSSKNPSIIFWIYKYISVNKNLLMYFDNIHVIRT